MWDCHSTYKKKTHTQYGHVSEVNNVSSELDLTNEALTMRPSNYLFNFFVSL